MCIRDRADLDAWEASVEGVGPDGEDAYPLFFNGVRNTARSFERSRDTFTTGLQWTNEAWDINFDWTYGKEQNDQLLQRYAISTPNIARSREGDVTSLVFDYGDQDFNRSTPTYGSMIAFEFEEANGSSRGRGTNRYIPRDQEIHVGGLNVNWSGDLWNINWDIGYAEQHTKRYDHQVGTQMNADDRLRWDSDPAFERMNGFHDQSNFHTTAGLTGVDEDGNLTPFDHTDLNNFKFNRVWFTLTEEWADDTSSRIDFVRELPFSDAGDVLSFFDAVMFGVAWNQRDARREKARWRENDVPGRGGDLTPFDTNDLVGGYQGVLIENYRPDINGVVHDYIILDNHHPVFDPIWELSDDELNTIQSNEFDITESTYAVCCCFSFDKLPAKGREKCRTHSSKVSQ